MLDPHTAYLLGYCVTHSKGDLAFITQFLEDIEPQDKENIAAGILLLFAKINPGYLEYICEVLQDHGDCVGIEKTEDGITSSRELSPDEADRHTMYA